MIDRTSLSGIIATRFSGKNKWLKTIAKSSLPNPNRIIAQNGGRVSLLSEVLEDGHVSSCIQSRKAGVLKLKWKIELKEGGDETQLAEIQSVFNSLKITKIIKEILNAPYFGFQPMEITWQYINGKFTPVDIIGKPQDWFGFDEFGRLKYIPEFSSVQEAKLVPKMKFFDVRYEPTYTNPYGDPILAKCYYPVLFKKDAFRLLARFLEKYGMPYLVGKLENYEDEDARATMAEELYALCEDGVVVVGDGKDVSLLDSASKASADIYSLFINYLNSDISKAILSQTLTTEQSSTGSYAMSQTHNEVRQDVIDADKALVEECFNNLIEWYFDINYGTDFEPPKFILYDETQINAADCTVAVSLMGTGQVQFTKDFFTRRGFKEDEFILVQPASPPPTFAENPTTGESISSSDAISTANMGVTALSKTVDNSIISKIHAIINEAKDFEEAYNLIINAYKDINENELEQIIADGITLAQTGGTLAGKV